MYQTPYRNIRRFLLKPLQIFSIVLLLLKKDILHLLLGSQHQHSVIMTIKIIINSSKLANVLPGRTYMWNTTNDDLVPAAGRSEVKAIVVLGNNVYKNGKPLVMYLENNIPNLFFDKRPTNI